MKTSMIRATIVTGCVFVSFATLPFLTRGQEQLAPPKTPTEYKRHEWEPPSDNIVDGSFGNNGVAQWRSPKSFEELWVYYARKLRIENQYQPNFTTGMSDKDGVTRVIHNSSNLRGPERLATLIRRDPKQNVTICLASAGSGTTMVFVTIQPNPK